MSLQILIGSVIYINTYVDNNIFIKSKYTKVYWDIIERAMCRKVPNGYVEVHHIIPKSLGGDNSSSNLVTLTAREHFLCHRLLVKITTGAAKRSMVFALHRMVHGSNAEVRITNRIYQSVRETFSQSMSDWWKENPDARKAAAQRGRERMKCPAYKKKMKQHKHNYWSNDENRKRASQQRIDWWKSLTPDQRKVLQQRQRESNTPDVRARKAHPGEQNGMYGRTHTKQVKKKLATGASKRFKGKTYEDLYGREKAQTLKQSRKAHMKEHRKKNPLNGEKNPNAKAVVIRGRKFNTSAEAAIYFNRSRPTISEWLRKYDDCYFIC